jgi:hypothetical protein
MHESRLTSPILGPEDFLVCLPHGRERDNLCQSSGLLVKDTWVEDQRMDLSFGSSCATALPVYNLAFA